MTTIGKNTVVGVSVGTLVAGLFAIWMVSGIGRPLFASDLVIIEQSIERLDKKTSVAVLNLAKQNLQTELRGIKRELRLDPNNGDIEDDVVVIENEIKEIDTKIDCYRRKDCDMEEDV
ncbi:hypothetical protein LCGC14_2069090 [marine sediment metagenome]|uniref:Uncharacterized protein n=1 Tax=marine sediment metagenome TaxID=412755 RepID=A0A0F9EJ28_9ZZZZ